MDSRQKIRNHIQTLLAEHGHDEPVEDGDSLILSGLLDSLAVIHIVVFMEKEFSIDFSDAYFDQSYFDTINDMVEFVAKFQK